MLFVGFLGFIFGICVGACIVYFFFVSEHKDFVTHVRTAIHSSFDEGVKHGRSKSYLAQLNDLSKKQVAYQNDASQPSKNATHSRFQNDIARLMMELNNQKIAIIKQMLKEDMDPTVKVQIDGEMKSLKISEVLLIMESRTKTDSMTIVKPKRTLSIVKDNSNVKPGTTTPDRP